MLKVIGFSNILELFSGYYYVLERVILGYENNYCVIIYSEHGSEMGNILHSTYYFTIITTLLCIYLLKVAMYQSSSCCFCRNGE